MAGLGIAYQSPGGAGLAISPTTGPVGTAFSVIGAPQGSTYQWTLNGTPISSATAASYTSTAAGTLGCLVTLAGATVTAVVAKVTPLTLGFIAPFLGAF